jgi:hypothetical protein
MLTAPPRGDGETYTACLGADDDRSIESLIG